MKTFDRKSKPSGGRDFGGRDFGGRDFGGGRDFSSGRDSGGRDYGGGYEKTNTMHKTTCSQCGSACEVPFRPSGERPVFCNNCFKRDGSSAPRRSFDDQPKRYGSDSGSSSTPYKSPDQSAKQFEAINAKLDKILEILGETEED